MKYRVTVGGTSLAVEVEDGRVIVGGAPCDAQLVAVPGTQTYHLLLDGASWSVALDGDSADGRMWVFGARGERLTVDVSAANGPVEAAPAPLVAAPPGETTLRAPMPGMVVRVAAVEGTLVEAGAELVVVEAMKMENELRARRPGRVARVHVRAGERVEKGALLVTLAAPEPSS